MPTYGETRIAKLASKLPTDYYTFPEPTIFSKRFSSLKNPDFVIVGANLGVVVLEVKDWKTIRRIDEDAFEIQRDTGEIVTETNPVKTAKEYAHNLADRLQELNELMHMHRGKLKLKFPWMYAAVLPNISYETIKECERKVWDIGQVISKDDLTPEKFETALLRISRPYSLKAPLHEDVLAAIYAVLKPEVRITNNDGDVIGIPTIIQNNIIEESPKLVPKSASIKKLITGQIPENISELAENTSARLIRGVAGSGKSLVLARKAQYLAEQNPDWRILVLAFNVDLVADLKRRIPGSKNLEITNFHKICSRILGHQWRSPTDTESWITSHINRSVLTQNGFTVEFVADEIEWRKEVGLLNNQEYLDADRKGRGSGLQENRRKILNQFFDQYTTDQNSHSFIDWSDVPYKTLASLRNGNTLKHYYDVILIDEAQDFAPSWMQVIKELLKPECLLFMCDDPTQSIFRHYSWKDKGVLVQGRTRHLRVPFRSTQAISQAAHSLLGTNSQNDLPDESLSPDFESYELDLGKKPELAKCNNLHEEIRLVEKRALDAAQLSSATGQVAILCHDKTLIRHWEHLQSRGIYVNSFRKMKGLEFQTVIIPDLGHAIPQEDTEIVHDLIEKQIRRIFTAMTRARENLVLTYHSSLAPDLIPLEPYVEATSG